MLRAERIGSQNNKDPMSTENISSGAHAAGSMARFVGFAEGVRPEGVYRVECIGQDGQLKWADKIENLVLNPGKQDLLDKYFSGSTYTAAFYLGLVDGATAPTFNAADTSASHAGWTENQAYSNATRPAPAWNSASSSGGGAGAAGTGSKTTTATSFNINAAATIAGCFLSTLNTKGGTTGITYSAGAFSGGNKVVANGDTLNVTYTAQA